MKLKLLRQVLVMSKYSLIGLFVQCLLFNVMWAKDGIAQNKSIDEVYLSIKLDNVRLIDALKEIESRTEFNFAYDKSLLNEQTKISVTARNKSLGFILKKISREAQLDFRRVDQQIYVKNNSNKKFLIDADGEENIYFQGLTITGSVKSSDDNEYLPGVNVIIKGTSKGTVTDVNGAFKIVVPDENTVLVFSSVGYVQQEVAVNNQSVINVEMKQDVTNLQEVVVIGYGEMKKSDLTSAYVNVGSDQIESTVNTTIDQALQGRAAGVYVTQNSGQPGGGVSVLIRGVSTITGSTEPLYVIDGVQVEGQSVSYGSTSSSNPIAGLNPSDIESIDVLQGPSATAIYGSRATNGVILITTKRGKAGETKVSYGFQYNLQTPPKKLDVMNLRQYAQMVGEYHDIAGGETPEEFLDPSLLGEGTDWQHELYRNAPMNNHQLSLSGGSEKTSFYLSGEYLNQDGMVLGSGFDRYSVRLNIDNKTREWLSIGANFSFNQTNEDLTTSQENIIQKAVQLTPQIPVQNLDGTWGGGDDTNGANQFAPVNPIALANLTTNDLTRRQFLGGLNLDIKIMEGLHFRTAFNSNLGFSQSNYYVPSYRFGYQVNPTASLTNSSNSNTYWNWNQLIQYDKQIGKHHIGLMASHEAQESSWKNLSGGRTGFVTDEVLDLNIGDASTATNGGGQGDWAMESYLGRLTYNYDDRYILLGTVRADGSVNFGPENRWGIFPSVSAAWRISQESFFNVPFINELKLRLESGMTGNQGSGQGIYSPLGSAPTQWGTGFLPNKYSNPELKWEETLTNNIGLNLGLFENRIQLEFDYYDKQTDNLLLDNPLPWYMGTNGTGSVGPPIVNIGSLENRGWSFTLNTVNINKGNFKWESNLNVSSFKTKIKAFYSETAILDRTSWWMDNWTQRSVVGQAPWLFLGYVEEGIFQSIEEIQNSALPVDNNGDELAIDEDHVWVGDVKFKDISGPEGKPDGIIDVNDLTFIGNPWPKLFAGFTNTFSYKGFDLSILLTGTYGNDIYNYTARANSNPNNINLSRNLLVDATNYAKITIDEEGNPVLENPDTNVPRISHGPNGNYERHTDKWVEDGSYIKVKNITLTYNLPSAFLSKQRIVQAARVSIGAQNVYTLTNYTGYDPEVGAYVGRDVSAANQAIGVDNGRYPLTPVYSLSVGIDF